MKVKSLFLMPLVCLSFAQPVYAAKMINKITGVGPNGAISPHFCIQNGDQFAYDLKPGEQVDGNAYSGNPYYVGGALRFGGCSTDNTYLGYVGFSVNDAQHTYAFQSYSPPEGVHIAYVNPGIQSDDSITGKIQYTSIQPNFNFLTQTPSQNLNWDFAGVNLSGLEFSKVIDPVVVPNLSAEDANGRYSDLAAMQSFLKAGMNTVRVPVSWGYLQLDGAGKGDLNLDYYNSYVKPLLETLTSARVHTIVDLHAYMRYSVFGKEYSGCGADGKCPDGTLVLDATAYQDVWTKLYALMKSDPNINMDYVMLDLVNEPVDVPDDLVFTIQAQAIKSLRQKGFDGYILVEGNAWSGLHSWLTETWKSRDGRTTYSNATLFTRENFAKAGITDLSKVIINAHQYLDSNYSGTHDDCQSNLKTTGPDGFNLNAFVDYLQQNRLKAIVTELGTGRDSASCKPALTAFLNYMKDNSAKNKDYGFIGWTIWSAGHGWGDYNLRVTPVSYHMQVMQDYLQPM